MNNPTPNYPAMDEARAMRHEQREIRMENDAHDNCMMHLAHTVRIERNESDIKTLFSKVGEAIGLMYKVDKRLEGLNGKIIGASAGASILIGVVMGLLQHLLK
jgi:hypothetical protein